MADIEREQSQAGDEQRRDRPSRRDVAADDGKAEDLGAFARQLRAAQKNGTLQKFGEKLNKDLRQPIH